MIKVYSIFRTNFVSFSFLRRFLEIRSVEELAEQDHVTDVHEGSPQNVNIPPLALEPIHFEKSRNELSSCAYSHKYKYLLSNSHFTTTV